MKLVENYRSISLLPIPVKCLERIVYAAIRDLINRMATWLYQGQVMCDSADLDPFVIGARLLMMAFK